MGKNQREINQKYRPIGLWYFLYTLISKFLCLFRGNVHFHREGLREAKKRMRKSKRGFIVVYNHNAECDHYTNTAAMNYTPTNFVLAKYFLFKPKMRKLIGWVKGIYKDQFVADINSIRSIRKAVERPGVVALAPAGQMSCDGGEQFVPRSIVKLIRFCKCDIVGLTTFGNHFYNPKWAYKNKRKIRIDVYLKLIVKKEELETISDDELYKRIYEVSSTNEFAHQEQVMSKMKGENLAVGLEGLLYRCPKCGEKYHVHTEGDTYTCDCGYSVKINEYGFFEANSNDPLIFKTEVEWNNYQKQELIKELEEDRFVERVIKVRLERNLTDPINLDTVGEGYVHITKDRFYYDGTQYGEIIHKEFAMDSLFLIPHGVHSHFFVPDTEGTYKFFPLDNELVVREVVQIIEARRDIMIKNGKEF